MPVATDWKGNQEPITNNQEPATKTHTPEPSRQDDSSVKPVDLSIAMQKFSIRIQPADPRLIELARQGVMPETMTAACEQARQAKPNETVPPGYVFAIVKAWREDAAALNEHGAKPNARASPRGYQTASDKRKSWCDELLGVTENDKRNEPIDITPPARFLD
jgi:hypothetical protein